ncbi:hypothetical protein THAOC_00682 [Thalassiosira oceanica]|uniref:Uncharacterized protein n=1 Tax=Thalassiosira oceanica TaxID=159749 RepID=K0TFC0_THAOC|nr:hypothetical protein THAOC_00682 [Thalassiosira oceanica]|eukprot:EJK77483.1 hypothetical protein THAOC_00682 [Thalassiosira oceanica]
MTPLAVAIGFNDSVGQAVTLIAIVRTAVFEWSRVRFTFSAAGTDSSEVERSIADTFCQLPLLFFLTPFSNSRGFIGVDSLSTGSARVRDRGIDDDAKATREQARARRGDDEGA